MGRKLLERHSLGRSLTILGCLSLFVLITSLDGRLAATGSPNAVACPQTNYGYPEYDNAIACWLALTGSQQSELTNTIMYVYNTCEPEASYVYNLLYSGPHVWEWTGYNDAGWAAWWHSSGNIGFHYDAMGDPGLVAHEGSHGVTNSTDESTPDYKQQDCLYPPAPSSIAPTTIAPGGQK